MRPRNLTEVVGHAALLGPNALLPRLIKADNFGSLLFYGPPGCGKTTLAEVIAAETESTVVRVNAVLSGTPELREVLAEARRSPSRKTVLVVDEIHRFNKAQQDLLLPDVEAGVVRLIGCTTHNPGLYIVPALLSRSHLFRLDPLGVDEIAAFLGTALADAERGLGALGIKASPTVLRQVAEMASGDLRRALNCLETLVLSAPALGTVTDEAVGAFARERRIRYDDGGDDHYDTASAFIKSVRGSDPDAALYWLFLMLEGGEEPRFIARRLVICASEDIGLADSRALGVATAAFQACEMVGLPECEPWRTRPSSSPWLRRAIAPRLPSRRRRPPSGRNRDKKCRCTSRTRTTRSIRVSVMVGPINTVTISRKVSVDRTTSANRCHFINLVRPGRRRAWRNAWRTSVN
jgi:putative ATPase